ncbi:MAG TPA: efflux RND transporter periplasmic adaptor subunit [Roseimicrobium sp.]|nr:efflux RND transporter periplasmic adaptor subunit [Roseimicrobium sp.]
MASKGIARTIKWFVVLAVIGGIAFVGVRVAQQDKKDGPEFQTTTITKGELTQAVTANGTLNPVLNVQVGSQISGMILKLNADFNSMVKAGDIVAELDPATYRAALNQSEGNLLNAKASLELAKVNAGRAADLRKNDLIAQSEYDQTRAALLQAEAQVKISEASVERARVDLNRCTIYAPVDGIVISRAVDVGQTVAASLSAPVLFQIANDLTKMQINANVSEADVGGVEVGQDVIFSVDAFPTRTFYGKVTQVRNSPVVVQNVVTYDTIIEVANKDMKLKPGMTANASIVVAQRSDTLKIANAGLRYRPVEPAKPEPTIFTKVLAAVGFASPPETNTTSTAKAATTNAPAAATGSAKTGDMAKSGPPSGEGDAPRAKGSGRGAGGGAGGRGAFAGRNRADRSPTRTVYILKGQPEPGKPLVPQPVTVKVGISDGTSTEILDGLKEGDVVVTGLTITGAKPAAAAAQTPPGGSSPFGGGGSMRRF